MHEYLEIDSKNNKITTLSVKNPKMDKSNSDSESIANSDKDDDLKQTKADEIEETKED